MQQKGLLMAAIMVFVLLCIPTGSAWAVDNDDAIIQKVFTLYQGDKGDPYTLMYPLELTGPGEIRVYARVDRLDPKPKSSNFQPLRLIIVDSRAFKDIKPGEWQQWCNKVNKFNPLDKIAGDEIRAFVRGMKSLFGKKEKPPAYFHGQIACGSEGTGESIKYAVDMPELQKTGGQYVIIFRNMADFRADGRILITYPGKHWELDKEAEQQAEVHPDLMVEGLTLNQNKQVVVNVANRGKGAVNYVKWHDKGPEAVTLLVKADNRNYGVTLPLLDPDFKLRPSGGTVSYVFDKVTIAKATQVSATIDAGDKVIEENEQNNSLTSTLGAGVQPVKIQPMKPLALAAKPDLAVTSIRLDSQRKVLIEVKNTGIAGLAPSLWNGGNQPYLNLKMNGNGWATVSLAGLDPQKNLSRKGGVAVYNTGYVLQQPVQVSASIDSTGVVDESNENNNTLVSNIAPQ